MMLSAPLVSDVLGGTAGTAVVGTVYDDANSDGVKSPGENGVSGWTVYLDLDNSGTLNTDANGTPEPSAVTNADGDFVINHLQPGNYRLGEVVQTGWTATAPVAQDVNVRKDHETRADFFNFAGGDIVGAVWNDLDGRGTRDKDPSTGAFIDPGLASWTVYLDLNNNLALDAGEPTTLTDADGNYAFHNLPSGDYEVTEVLPDGWDVTRKADVRQTATVVALQQTVADFGNISIGAGSVQGSIWNDLNADGVRATDPATGTFTDPGLEGWTVFLDTNKNGIADGSEPVTLTNANGDYVFIGVPAGDYEVTEILPDGWNVSPTFDTRQTVTVFAGAATTAGDFANFTVLNGSIGGTVWNDLNRDGIRNVDPLSGVATDPGLAGWQVFLDLNRNRLIDVGEPTTLTDVSGNYFFSNLQVGDYEVQEILPTGWETSSTFDDRYSVTVFSGTESFAPDFANFNLSTAVAGSISGTVWNDINGNGVRDVDPGTGAFTDPGLSSWVVFADLNSNGVLDATEPNTTSGADGSYTLSGVLPGTVSVVEIAQAGWRATAPIGGARTIALKNAENATGLDFGNYTLQEAAIRGTVFNDANHDGIRNPGEKGLAGITVYLDTNNNGVLDSSESRISTLSDQFFTPTTDEAGTWSFTHLAPGTYTVRTILPETLSATPIAELTHSVTLVAAENHNGVDTAAVFRPNEIHGTKFDDSNGNHQRDPGEAGVGGKTIYIDLDRDNILDPGEPTTVTLPDGSYSFGNLTPGAYVVRELVESGHEATYPNTQGGTLWPAGVSNPAVGNVTPTSITTSLATGETHRETVSITLPNTGALTNLVDVFLLFDDTGSFVNNSPIVRAAFPAIISQLQTSLPGIDLGFGVGRFEEYANYAWEYSTGRPFVLNQPIVAASTAGYMTAIQAALDRTTPGYGGDTPETDFEALYQLVTGVGFDGNNNGSVLDSGAAGLASTQLNPGDSGDVPSFASFVADAGASVMPAAGNIGGGGFRAGALPIILLATDTGFAYQPKGETSITGLGGLTLPLSSLTQTSRPDTPFNSGAGIQQTVTALNALGALVIGLGTNPEATLDPRQGLESISKLTGAINRSTATIDNGTIDPISPNDPLYFQIASGFGASVSNGVVNAIQNAVTTVAMDITVQASDPRVKIINHSGVQAGIGSGQTATFDIEFVGDGVPHRFDLQFVRAGTNVVVGSIPVVIGTPIPGNCYEFEDLPEGEIHSSVDFGSHQLGVTTPTVAVTGGTFTYDNTAHAASATAVDGGGNPVNGIFSFTYNGSATLPTAAGVYSVVATFISSDPNFTDANGAATLTINAATPAINVIGGTFQEDGASHAATAEAVGIGGVLVGGTFSFTYNGSSSAPTAAGTYNVIATFSSTDANYTDATGATTLTINPSLSIQSIAPVTPSPRTSAVSSVNVTFSAPLNLSTFTAADLSLTVDGGANLLAGPTLPFPVTFALVAGTTSTYRINGLTNYTGVNGAYQLTVNAGGIQDASGHTGSGSASTSWVLNTVVPKIAYIAPVSPNPRETAVDSIDVTFSKGINLATLTTADLTLKLNNIVVPFAGTETVSFVGGTTYRIAGLAGLTGAVGSYSLTVNAAGVQDVGGTSGTGSATSTWSLKLVPPTVTLISPVSPNPTNVAVDTFDVTFSEPINPATFDLADLTLKRSNVVVPLAGTETLTYLSGNTWRIGGLAGLTSVNGAYSLTVSTVGIQDANGVAGATSKAVTWIEDFTSPTILSITTVTPNPRNAPVDALKFTLSEKVKAGTLTLANLSLTRNGGANLLTGAESLTLVSGNTWQLGGLSGLTAEDGSYALNVDATGLVDLAGNAGTGAKSFTWTMDTLAPTSSIAPFAAPTATSLSLVLSITGNDPVPANGAVPSGLKNYDIYVSTDGGAFAFWKTASASTTSATTKVTFAAQSDHTYAFHSVARDKAGNVEAKSLDVIEASIAVPDLSPPTTQVTGIDDTSVSTFTVSMHGSDIGSNGVVASFDLYVSIDGAAAKRIATIPGGPSDGFGIYHAQAQYRALSDGLSHTYRFYSVGKDGTGKTEAAPAAPADFLVSASFPSDQVTGFDVQKGQAQRSYVRNVDLLFSRPDDVAAMVASISDGISGNDALTLRRYTLAGTSPVTVSLAGKLSAVGNQIAIDFGATGLTTDGYYELGVDLDGNGTIDQFLHFDRLLGDLNGDRMVDAGDKNLLALALLNGATDRFYDVNGDGLINSADQTKLTTLLGHQLAAGLPLDD